MIKRGSPVLAAVVVASLYVAWAVAIAIGGDPVRLALPGHKYLDQGRGSSAEIDAVRANADGFEGYDGQFALYIALDPLDASAYIDYPAYRFSRILYPLVTKVLALNQAGAMGWALLLVNIAAAGLLTFWAGRLLAARGTSAWYAAVVGLAPALAVGILRDLTEPLAFALVAAGLFLLYRGASRGHVLAAAFVFALAGLGRETTLLFPIAAALCLALGIGEQGKVKRRPADALLLLAASAGPQLVWRVASRLFVSGYPPLSSSLPEVVPFSGLFSQPSFGASETLQLMVVVLPACLALTLVMLAVRRITFAVVALTANVIFLVVLLPEGAYVEFVGSARVALGVQIAFILCLPLVESGRRRLVLALTPATYWSLAWFWVGLNMVYAY